MPVANLRPLDFSTLLHYNEALPCSPQARWSSILSPLCSAARSSPTVLDSSVSSLPFSSGSPYFGSFSPLCGTPKTLKTWGANIPSYDFFSAESKPLDKEFVESQPLHNERSEQPPEQPPQMSMVSKPEIQQKVGPRPMDQTPTLPDLLHASSVMTGTSLSQSSSVLTPSPSTISKPTAKPEKKPSKRTSPVISPIDKAAERRRKNRESSSRCYYNRKRIIETLDKQISEEKSKLTQLYDRALELRHENAKLKKDVVTNGIALPTKARGTNSGSSSSAFQLRGYLHLLQSAQFYSNQ